MNPPDALVKYTLVLTGEEHPLVLYGKEFPTTVAWQGCVDRCRAHTHFIEGGVEGVRRVNRWYAAHATGHLAPSSLLKAHGRCESIRMRMELEGVLLRSIGDRVEFAREDMELGIIAVYLAIDRLTLL